LDGFYSLGEITSWGTLDSESRGGIVRPAKVTALTTARRLWGTITIRGQDRVFELGSQALDMVMQGAFQFGGQHGDLFVAGAGEQAIT